MKQKIGIISLGCPKNLVDSEVMLGLLKNKGYTITDKVENSDIAIVNTCSFINSATEESVETILRLIELKKKHKIKALIVAGCLPQKYKKKDLLEGFREVNAFIGTGDFPKIDTIVERIVPSRQSFIVDSSPGFLYDEHNPRYLLSPEHYVYVKVAEGCRNRCSYCLIPQLRGDFRSRRMASVIKEVRSLCRKNRIAEINLIAQDTTLYGIDIYGRVKLVELLRKLIKLKACKWLRFLYTHPAHFTEDLIELVKDEPSICKYIDLPLQHINDKILARMRRKITRKEIISLIEKLRKKIPDLTLRTSFIVGFPGETEKQFEELLNFIQKVKFNRLGAFFYSREENTSAYNFPKQVPEKIKKERFKELMKTQQSISRELNKSFVDKEIEVLVDGRDPDSGVLLCRSQGDAPEIDGYVFVKSKNSRPGDFLKVKITSADTYDLFGEPINRRKASLRTK